MREWNGWENESQLLQSSAHGCLLRIKKQELQSSSLQVAIPRRELRPQPTAPLSTGQLLRRAPSPLSRACTACFQPRAGSPALAPTERSESCCAFCRSRCRGKSRPRRREKPTPCPGPRLPCMRRCTTKKLRRGSCPRRCLPLLSCLSSPTAASRRIPARTP
eukprot:2403496-Rhodomonas_salina.1